MKSLLIEIAAISVVCISVYTYITWEYPSPLNESVHMNRLNTQAASAGGRSNSLEEDANDTTAAQIAQMFTWVNVSASRLSTSAITREEEEQPEPEEPAEEEEIYYVYVGRIALNHGGYEFFFKDIRTGRIIRAGLSAGDTNPWSVTLAEDGGMLLSDGQKTYAVRTEP